LASIRTKVSATQNAASARKGDLAGAQLVLRDGVAACGGVY